jgi:hypothetical protein
MIVNPRTIRLRSSVRLPSGSVVDNYAHAPKSLKEIQYHLKAGWAVITGVREDAKSGQRLKWHYFVPPANIAGAELSEDEVKELLPKGK